MKISVAVKAGAKEERIEQIGENYFSLRVKAPAVEGKANQAVIKLLSEYFDIPKSRVSIIKGEKSKNKICCINLIR